VAGQGTPATAIAAKSKINFKIHEYAHDARKQGFGTEAANALGIPPSQCFKTLVADIDGTLTVGVVPVDGSLDLKALAAAVGGKRASMADPVLAERTTGYVRGGISPLGQRKRLRTVIDASAEALPTMFVSAGRRGLEIELSPLDLAALTDAAFASIRAD
jgi:Cys-tRNA(Pro)/Cys-tRNA(Cys) deacylase